VTPLAQALSSSGVAAASGRLSPFSGCDRSRCEAAYQRRGRRLALGDRGACALCGASNKPACVGERILASSDMRGAEFSLSASRRSGDTAR
jgi:hypothetical protein